MNSSMSCFFSSLSTQWFVSLQGDAQLTSAFQMLHVQCNTSRRKTCAYKFPFLRHSEFVSPRGDAQLTCASPIGLSLGLYKDWRWASSYLLLVLSSIERSVVSIHVLSAVCDATRVTDVLLLTVLISHTHRLTSSGECIHIHAHTCTHHSIVLSSIGVANIVWVQL